MAIKLDKISKGWIKHFTECFEDELIMLSKERNDLIKQRLEMLFLYFDYDTILTSKNKTKMIECKYKSSHNGNYMNN